MANDSLARRRANERIDAAILELSNAKAELARAEKALAARGREYVTFVRTALDQAQLAASLPSRHSIDAGQYADFDDRLGRFRGVAGELNNIQESVSIDPVPDTRLRSTVNGVTVTRPAYNKVNMVDYSEAFRDPSLNVEAAPGQAAAAVPQNYLVDAYKARFSRADAAQKAFRAAQERKLVADDDRRLADREVLPYIIPGTSTIRPADTPLQKFGQSIRNWLTGLARGKWQFVSDETLQLQAEQQAAQEAVARAEAEQHAEFLREHLENNAREAAEREALAEREAGHDAPQQANEHAAPRRDEHAHEPQGELPAISHEAGGHASALDAPEGDLALQGEQLNAIPAQVASEEPQLESVAQNA